MKHTFCHYAKAEDSTETFCGLSASTCEDNGESVVTPVERAISDELTNAELCVTCAMKYEEMISY